MASTNKSLAETNKRVSADAGIANAPPATLGDVGLSNKRWNIGLHGRQYVTGASFAAGLTCSEER
jgi:hypothetical protein